MRYDDFRRSDDIEDRRGDDGGGGGGGGMGLPMGGGGLGIGTVIAAPKFSPAAVRRPIRPTAARAPQRAARRPTRWAA
jgi:predicted metalloprotease